MLELDYMLQQFCESELEQLDATELRCFENLLRAPDTLLLEYLMGRTVPMDPGLAHVTGKIRRTSTR